MSIKTKKKLVLNKKNDKSNNINKTKKILKGGASSKGKSLTVLQDRTLTFLRETEFEEGFRYELIAAIADREVDLESFLEVTPFTYYKVSKEDKDNLNQILTIRKGNGNFGETFQVNAKLGSGSSPKKYILKTNLLKKNERLVDIKNKLLREARIMNIISEDSKDITPEEKNNLKFIRIEGILKHYNKYYLISDLCASSSISQYINFKDLISSGDIHIESEKSNFIKPHIPEFFIQIFQGLRFINSKKIVHRDIHPRNILICDRKAKIIDFGISIKEIPDKYDKYDTEIVACNPKFITCPIIYKDNAYRDNYGRKKWTQKNPGSDFYLCDLWSYFILILHVVIGIQPDINMDNVYNLVHMKKYNELKYYIFESSVKYYDNYYFYNEITKHFNGIFNESVKIDEDDINFLSKDLLIFEKLWYNELHETEILKNKENFEKQIELNNKRNISVSSGQSVSAYEYSTSVYEYNLQVLEEVHRRRSLLINSVSSSKRSSSPSSSSSSGSLGTLSTISEESVFFDNPSEYSRLLLNKAENVSKTFSDEYSRLQRPDTIPKDTSLEIKPKGTNNSTIKINNTTLLNSFNNFINDNHDVKESSAGTEDKTKTEDKINKIRNINITEQVDNPIYSLFERITPPTPTTPPPPPTTTSPPTNILNGIADPPQRAAQPDFYNFLIPTRNSIDSNDEPNLRNLNIVLNQNL